MHYVPGRSPELAGSLAAAYIELTIRVLTPWGVDCCRGMDLLGRHGGQRVRVGWVSSLSCSLGVEDFRELILTQPRFKFHCLGRPSTLNLAVKATLCALAEEPQLLLACTSLVVPGCSIILGLSSRRGNSRDGRYNSEEDAEELDSSKGHSRSRSSR